MDRWLYGLRVNFDAAVTPINTLLTPQIINIDDSSVNEAVSSEESTILSDEINIQEDKLESINFSNDIELISKVMVTNGAYENHVDALETMRNLNFRSNTTKFAVLITDEPLTTNDNKLKIGAAGIADNLKNSGIITSVVCLDSNRNTFTPIWERTDGIQISITSNFTLYLETFIKTVMRQNNVFNAVIPNSLSVISLKETPSKTSSADTDGDGLKDMEEIDWRLIKEINGTLRLPTLMEYISSFIPKGLESFARLGEEKAKIIHSIVVLPIYSNPTKKDSDGDLYLDPDDPRPLMNDVEIIELSKSEYIKIDVKTQRVGVIMMGRKCHMAEIKDGFTIHHNPYYNKEAIL